MTNAVTANKSFTLPTINGDTGIWGVILNNTIGFIDSAVGGSLHLSISGDVTISSTQAQNAGYYFTGTLTSNATITWTKYSGLIVIRNNTTGGFAITCLISGGASIIIDNGNVALLWSDGVDFLSLDSGGSIGGHSSSKTSAYTVLETDKGITLSCGGEDQYQITVPSASGFDNNFQVRIYNIDDNHGKDLAITGYTSFILWPRQSIIIHNIDGEWQLYPRKQRWEVPGSTSFYVDPSGNDNNDGLTQANAMATVLKAWNTIRDFTEGPCGIQLTPGTVYNVSPMEFDGDNSVSFGRLVAISGDPTLVSPAVIVTSSGGPIFTFRDGAWATVSGLEFQTTVNASVAISVQQKALCDLYPCVWGHFPGGALVSISDDGDCNFTGTTPNHRITSGTAGFGLGSAGVFFAVGYGGKITLGTIIIDCTHSHYDFTVAFFVMDTLARGELETPVFINAESFTGKKFQLSNGSFLRLGGTTIPGTIAGTFDSTSNAF